MMEEKPCPEAKYSKVKKTEEENNFFPAGKNPWVLVTKLSKCELLLR